MPELAPLPWMDDAQCVDHDPELWFRGDNQHAHQDAYDQAMAICSTCPANAACLEHALRIPVEGIWGGLTTEQRRTLHRRNRR